MQEPPDFDQAGGDHVLLCETRLDVSKQIADDQRVDHGKLSPICGIRAALLSSRRDPAKA